MDEARIEEIREHLRTRFFGGQRTCLPFPADEDLFLDIAISRSIRLALHTDAAVDRWLKERLRRAGLRSRMAALSSLEHWRIDGLTGDISHETGSFFSILGLRVRHRTSRGELVWDQPMIDQPEIGILGILARKFKGVLHFCLQAKEEPGNIHSVQLSPTVQATYSNYRRVHGGATTPLINYFLDPPRDRMLFAKLQSEDGGRFLFKSNRNMIVLVDENVPLPPEGFLWLTLRQISSLLKRDNVVNACARSVLAALI